MGNARVKRAKQRQEQPPDLASSRNDRKKHEAIEFTNAGIALTGLEFLGAGFRSTLANRPVDRS
jgi:hypothetical protein